MMLKKFYEDTRNTQSWNKKYRLILFAFLFFLALFAGITLLSYDKERAKKLYLEQCSKCHRKDGRGIKGVYPPLKNSDYVQNGDKIELLRGMLFGRSGKIIVNGEVYYGVMITEVDKSLSDEDIALILMYVYKEMNNMDVEVTSKDVQRARKEGKLPPHK
ncbi:MAG: cytochrome c [Ignavibacteria bacterium]|nr:cytochrome c [Ignavibacteria bacterium]